MGKKETNQEKYDRYNIALDGIENMQRECPDGINEKVYVILMRAWLAIYDERETIPPWD